MTPTEESHLFINEFLMGQTAHEYVEAQIAKVKVIRNSQSE